MERVVGAAGNPYRVLEETLALGFLVVDKWNRAQTAHGASPTVQQVANEDEFTDLHFVQFQTAASRSLSEFAASLPRGAKQSWWYGVGQGLAAAFLYSLGLLAIFLLATWLRGGDFAHLLGAVGR